MPDETQSSGSSLDTNNDLESLVAEAEQQAALPVIDHPRPCPHTFDESTHLKCPTCLWSFCTLCASSLDPRYCHLCLSEPAAELLDLPLIDRDGISHDGRVLSPAPGATFFSPRLDLPCNTLLKTISQMSDSEVDDYVTQYKDLVRQAERALDFRRVVLGASQLEQSQRKDITQRKLRSDKTKYVVKTITMDTRTGKQVTKTASAQKLGDMLKMLEALQKLKEVKK